jgi:hypothetical protein
MSPYSDTLSYKSNMFYIMLWMPFGGWHVGGWYCGGWYCGVWYIITIRIFWAQFSVCLKSIIKTSFYFLVQYTRKCINFTHLSHKPIKLCGIYSRWKKNILGINHRGHVITLKRKSRRKNITRDEDEGEIFSFFFLW